MLSYSVRLSFQWKDKRVLWGIHTIKLDLSTLLVIRDDESSQWILFEANYVSRCTFIPMFPITRTQDQDQETPGGCAVLSCFLRIFPPIREEWITYAKTTSPLKPPWNLGLLFIDREPGPVCHFICDVDEGCTRENCWVFVLYCCQVHVFGIFVCKSLCTIHFQIICNVPLDHRRFIRMWIWCLLIFVESGVICFLRWFEIM